jgi:hypothetical protein
VVGDSAAGNAMDVNLESYMGSSGTCNYADDVFSNLSHSTSSFPTTFADYPYSRINVTSTGFTAYGP